ncbi:MULTISPECIES: DUF805 domain-containing protein [Empedobacter]|uniref:DUF805 domain-containing protein n=1 Tax=Empedobacter TaxID=59734 RepID=UPI0025C0A838|nr:MULTISPECIES: DUF805 domain-containing protein [unclassified Empedobacter]
MLYWFKKVVVENYANFTGRARRSEFWYFSLFKLIIPIIILIPCIILTIVFSNNVYAPAFMGSFLVFFLIFEILLIIPTLAVSARRLHDIGYSGWLQLISLIPGGEIVLLIFFLMVTQPMTNQ